MMKSSRKLKNRVAAQTARDRKRPKWATWSSKSWSWSSRYVDSYLGLFVSLFFIPVLRKGLISTCFPQNQKLHIENRLLLEKTSDLLG